LKTLFLSSKLAESMTAIPAISQSVSKSMFLANARVRNGL